MPPGGELLERNYGDLARHVVKLPAMVFWFYGRSAAGKTTLADGLRATLKARGMSVILLDGDEVRHGLCRDLGFEEKDRTENHRRVAEVAKILSDQGITVLAATMAPQSGHRSVISEVLGSDVKWIFVDAPVKVCAQRDPKGLYAKAAGGGLTLFKDYPFDLPGEGECDLRIATDEGSIADCISSMVDHFSVFLEEGE